MRRSSSSSSIPVAVGRSRSTIRTSGCNTQRAPSLDGPTSSRKTIGFMHRSKSQLHLNVRTPSVNAPRSSLKTPLSSTSKKSPMHMSAKKEKRPINDKKWQHNNLYKVQNFLLDNSIDAAVVQQLKPMTTTLFVDIVNFLFKEIDSRIEITMANYKEMVPSNLKTFGYPDNVSVSLMKTVNASHAWPQVLAIFAWLVDLITYLRTYTADFLTFNKTDEKYTETLKLLTEYSFARFNLTHGYGDLKASKETIGALKDNLYEVFEVDQNEDTQKSIEILRKNHEEYVESIKNKELTAEALTKEIISLKKQIEEDELEEKTFTTLYEQEIKKYQEEFDENEQRRLTLLKENEKLKEMIKTQPFSLSDKLKLEKDKKDLLYTLSLKDKEEESLQNMNQELDFRVTEIKRKFEKHIVELNQEIRKISITLPELSELLIRESGYNRLDFKEILENVLKRNEELKIKFKQQIEDNTNSVKDFRKEISDAEKQLTKLTEDVFTLKKIETTKQTELDQLKAKYELEVENLKKTKDEIVAKIDELKRMYPNTDDYKEQIEMKQQEKEALKQMLETNQVKAVEFFEKLTKQILDNKDKIMAIKRGITESLTNEYENLLKCYETLNEKYEKMFDEDKKSSGVQL